MAIFAYFYHYFCLSWFGLKKTKTLLTQFMNAPLRQKDTAKVSLGPKWDKAHAKAAAHSVENRNYFFTSVSVRIGSSRLGAHRT